MDYARTEEAQEFRAEGGIRKSRWEEGSWVREAEKGASEVKNRKNDAASEVPVKAGGKGWEEQAPQNRERKQQDGRGEAGSEACGWNLVVKSGNGTFFDSRPRSPSACVDAGLSWGEGYSNLGYFERVVRVEAGGWLLQVRVAYTAAAVEEWLSKCTAEDKLFGFDLKWRPDSLSGDDNKAAVLQLSLASRCLVVQLLFIDRIPSSLVELLADPQVKLGGVGIKVDSQKLLVDHGLRCRGEVDLAVYAAQVLNQNRMCQAGLSTLSQSILGLPHRTRKALSCSNWEVEGLSFSQIRYAASDAWISYSLLVALHNVEAQGQARLGREGHPTQPHVQPFLLSMEERIRDMEDVVAFLKQRAARNHRS